MHPSVKKHFQITQSVTVDDAFALLGDGKARFEPGGDMFYQHDCHILRWCPHAAVPLGVKEHLIRLVELGTMAGATNTVLLQNTIHIVEATPCSTQECGGVEQLTYANLRVTIALEALNRFFCCDLEKTEFEDFGTRCLTSPFFVFAPMFPFYSPLARE